VDDTATALLMQRFYQNILGKLPGLKAPMPRADGLWEAKQWLRQFSRSERDAYAASLGKGALRAVEKSSKPIVAAASSHKSDAPPYAHPYYWAAFVLFGDPD
jgi:CHAT domain-containing protein